MGQHADVQRGRRPGYRCLRLVAWRSARAGRAGRECVAVADCDQVGRDYSPANERREAAGVVAALEAVVRRHERTEWNVLTLRR